MSWWGSLEVKFFLGGVALSWLVNPAAQSPVVGPSKPAKCWCLKPGAFEPEGGPVSINIEINNGDDDIYSYIFCIYLIYKCDFPGMSIPISFAVINFASFPR